MNKLSKQVRTADDEMFLVPTEQSPLALPSMLTSQTSNLLKRMFRDPRVLEPHERGDLVTQLRQAVEVAPHIPEVRVLLGMALCVDLQAQEALEQLREAANQAPDSFIAHLKFGELLMRLRVCGQAAEETHKAAQLASNAMQSELARRQATMLRTMTREGIERGGYRALLPKVLRFGGKSLARRAEPALIVSE